MNTQETTTSGVETAALNFAHAKINGHEEAPILLDELMDAARQLLEAEPESKIVPFAAAGAPARRNSLYRVFVERATGALIHVFAESADVAEGAAESLDLQDLIPEETFSSSEDLVVRAESDRITRLDQLDPDRTWEAHRDAAGAIRIFQFERAEDGDPDRIARVVG